MSKILVMAGSPRKEGNTDTLVKAFAEGASKEEDMFEVLKLHYASLISHFHLEDAGMVLVSGVREKGELSDKDIKAAYELGLSIS